MVRRINYSEREMCVYFIDQRVELARKIWILMLGMLNKGLAVNDICLFLTKKCRQHRPEGWRATEKLVVLPIPASR